MIEPTATDVLCSIEACFETVIRPGLAGTAERSAAATVGHLLRHLRLRLESEGVIRAADEARQAPLLAWLDRYFASIGDAQGCSAMAPGQGFQQALEAALRRLVALRAVHGGTSEYQDMRHAMRAEMAAQLQSEAALIEPAFAGHGPRR